MAKEDINNENITAYDASSIRHLSDIEHIRTRPGMYIGRLGDGSHSEDGIYVLLKEAIDNSIDEFRMNEGKRIEIDIEDKPSGDAPRLRTWHSAGEDDRGRQPVEYRR